MLQPPEKFDFPFTPYDIQHDFMTNLYRALEQGKLGIFESPTGTGKSLSIICGALKWLKDHNERVRNDLSKQIEELISKKFEIQHDKDNDDWIVTQAAAIEISQNLHVLFKKNKKITEYDERLKLLKKRTTEIKVKRNKYLDKIKSNDGPKEANASAVNDENMDEDDNLLLDEIVQSDIDKKEYLSDDEDSDENKYEDTKILICSRTHSQLAQLVSEVVRSPYGKNIRVVSLASRQSYCINPSVNRLKSNALINQRCLDMKRNQKASVKKDEDGKTVKRRTCDTKSGKCNFLCEDLLEDLRDEALLEPHNVEQLINAGKELKACPYYASRAAVQDAQVIFVPYNTLLHKSTREANGIKIKDNIVIVDEAHNLLEAITHMHSIEVSGQSLQHAHKQLNHYKTKFSTRFSAKNLLCINQLLFIMGKLMSVLEVKSPEVLENVTKGTREADTMLYSVWEFKQAAEIDNFDLRKLMGFCDENKLAQRLHGYALKYDTSVEIAPAKAGALVGIKSFLKELSMDKNKKTEQDKSEAEKQQTFSNSKENVTNPLLPVLAFLDCLKNISHEAKIVCTRAITIGKRSIKYLLLDPSSQFEDIVKDARAVILAGGTMKPNAEFRDRLFKAAGAPAERIYEFSCDHVVPPENILTLAMCQGPTGQKLDFSFEHRTDTDVMAELIRVLRNCCNVIPAGIVCFFGSYQYETLVHNALVASGALDEITKRKRLFREPPSTADVDKVLTDYAKCIKNCTLENKQPSSLTGALMFSVVGGKLSEGLNFNDDLCRCVIVVGLPYPNIKSLELQDKMTHLDKTEGKGAGNVYYENLCMKAVNQCIGRAVRHRNDYATIVLLDHRYSRQHIQNGLPNWISKSLVTCEQFGRACACISKFFAGKRKPSNK